MIIANAILLQSKQRTVDPTEQFLIENARAFWKFDGTGTITQVNDLTGNNYHLRPDVSPWNYNLSYYDYRFADYSRRGVYRAEDNGLWLSGDYRNLLRQSFEFHYVGCGFAFSDHNLAGVVQTTNSFRVYIDVSGRLVVICRFSGSGATTLRTINSVIYGTGSQGRKQYTITHFRIQINFENDTFRIWVNGGEFATELVSGVAVSSWSATYYPGTAPFGIGTYNNNNGASQGQGTYYRDVFGAAFTDILTDEQAWDVTKYFQS